MLVRIGFLFTIFITSFTSFAFAESATGTEKFYKLPKEGMRIKISEANFSIFPDNLFFAPGKNLFLISKKWQTACLYDLFGKKKADYCVQVGTGKKDFPTEIGLYNIQTKFGKNYKSTFYDLTGGKPQKPEDGAPMPFAMHIGRVIGISPEKKFWFDFSDGTAIHEKQTVNKYGSVAFVSHGCVAVEKGFAERLQKKMRYGDLVLVFNDHIPPSIDKMISISE
jgi:hypothetical protein